MSEERTIPLRRFWIIKGVLIFCFAVSCAWAGYFAGTYRMSLKIEVAKVLAQKEIENKNPALRLISSGQSFCYNQGNLYPAKIIPVKNRSLLPLFKAVRTEEF